MPEERNAYRVLVETSETKRPPIRLGRRWEYIIKLDDLDLILLVQIRTTGGLFQCDNNFHVPYNAVDILINPVSTSLAKSWLIRIILFSELFIICMGVKLGR
jgi:hypothetical protein